MKDVRFYVEYANKTEKGKSGKGAGTNHSGTVMAIFVGNEYWSGGQYVYGGMGAIQNYPDSPVATTGVSFEYLRENCKRIPESVARQIHPELFRCLDN